ncbi:hypothetical protein CXB51_032297 [Gossypium anomalum]|uniref:STAS domain-containing protein n=1 Tax=Gossypium anomalum TaxID=47600 RepID=A0A8J5YS53_9ROSI|nr:hypothetical protein CXB51_032297 [Gossypium anomalum]
MESNPSTIQEQSPSCLEITMEVHSVVPPPHKSTIQKLKTRLKETLFPDDPFRQFKGQPTKKKWVLAAQYIFPILHWGPNYNLKLFKSDIVSGVTIASLAIPQGISYAKLASLPPNVGLYSSFVPPLVYAVLGSSRDIAVGPVSIASLILGSMLTQQVSPTGDPVLFLQLAFTATFFAGFFQASLGFLRLGFIIDFLSKATLIGFMAGAAIIVSLQQLKSLLGITHFSKKMGFIPVMASVFHNSQEWSWQTILMGFSFLVFLLVARHVSMRRPKLFWVSAAAPLVCVILSTFLVFAFKAQHHGVGVVSLLPLSPSFKLQYPNNRLNPPSWNMLQFHGGHLGLSMKTGLVTGIISLTEGIAVGRTFASLMNYKVDGAKTAASNIVMSITVMVTLLFLMPLFQYTPNVVLGAIIVSAVVGLIDIPAAYHVWKMDKFDFIVMLCAFFGVIFISVQHGLAIAVAVSIFKILMQITRPKTVLLGKIPGTDIYRDLHHYKESVKIPGFLILSIEAPINFANSTYLNERVLRWIEEYEAEDPKMHSNSSLRFVILEMSTVSTIDTSGVSFFKELKRTMEKKGVELVLVNLVGEVMEKLQRSNEAGDFMKPDCLFLTVGEAVATLSATIKGQSSNDV